MPLSPRLVICTALVPLLTAAGGCGKKADATREADPPIPVTVEAVQLGDVRAVVSATGVVETLAGADFLVTAPAPARIVELTAQPGDRVKSGDVLVRFEFPSLRVEEAARAAAVRSAEAMLNAATLTQTRIRSLLSRGAASQKEADDADRDVATAEADLALARTAQSASRALGEKAVVRAPFDAVVAERLHNSGDSVGVTANDLILRIIDPRQVEVTATVPAGDIHRFAIGAAARAVPEGTGTQELLRVASRPEPEAGATTVPVRLTFDVSTLLPSGSQVGVEIDAEQRSNVALVPSIAVVMDAQNKSSVFVVSGNRARKRAVTTGLLDAGRIEIQSGLRPGDLVVTQGQTDLRDDAEVTFRQ